MMLQGPSERLSALRREIEAAGFDGFIVPRTDEYQGEYIPPCAERVAYISGFTGSAATLVILKDKAAFFTDGRYTLQASRQVSAQDYALFDTASKTPLAWLEENVPKGARIAYDPWLHSAENAERLRNALARAEAESVPVARNLVDIVWEDRPPAPVFPIRPHEAVFAGKPSAEKRADIAAELKKKDLLAALITSPASVAWLLNVRGGDIPHAPLPLSRALVRDDGSVEWFLDPRKRTEGLAEHVGPQVALLPLSDFPTALGRLARTGRSILLDPVQAPSWVVDFILGAHGKIEHGDDPCVLPRAIKNAAELEGMRAAHVRDGAALAAFFAWLEAHWEQDQTTELDADHRLEAFRAANIRYRGVSFETISATGEHGAIVHYAATEETNAPLLPGQLYLLDSGGQYLDGTTDVTRTIALGVPTAEMRENYTRVLKGHIAIATVRFPEGTAGADLDTLARQHLWAVGRDYAHGTGHGVGAYLSVHEGPHALSRRNRTPLRPGMILTNEPGYYKAGAYGIRLENVMTIVEIEGLSTAEHKVYGFDTLTFAPFDRRLIDVSLLTECERRWIDAYHHRVLKTLRERVDEATAQWLDEKTRKLEE